MMDRMSLRQMGAVVAAVVVAGTVLGSALAAIWYVARAGALLEQRPSATIYLHPPVRLP